mmetsp:Transcript_92927/g.250777  ORF Transcript_92927/g.250777 Transcript_92927/m.250777 type:complete len:91 (+) Transcript_92927:80-352(+)
MTEQILFTFGIHRFQCVLQKAWLSDAPHAKNKKHLALQDYTTALQFQTNITGQLLPLWLRPPGLTHFLFSSMKDFMKSMSFSTPSTGMPL